MNFKQERGKLVNANMKTAIVILLIIITAGCGWSANNRPLIYGMNPTPMDWWGYDANTWDPILFTKMAEGGCTSARMGVNWDQIEPVKGQRDWSSVDRWVKYCLDRNIEPVLLINSTPEWALPADYDPNIVSYVARYPAGEDHVDDFNKWIYDLVRRYRGQARYYEFWNEANGYGWYTALQSPPSYSRADLYVPWMRRAYVALKQADPTSQMSTTGIDDSGGGNAAYYLQQIYKYGGKGYFDAVADHPYPNGGEFQPWKLDNIRSALDSKGDTQVKVWITEFGYNWSSFATQLQNYFDTITQDRYDYLRIATWHTANEFPWESGYGLLDSNLNPKPEYNAFKDWPKPARPTISNFTVTNLSASSVQISYATNVAAKGLVMYGKDDKYGQITGRETASVTSHSATLSGLDPATAYHFRIRAGAIEDGDSFSADQTFTTVNGSVVHVTAGPTVSDITDSSATISWTTDVPSTSAVDYGLDFNYGASSSDSQLTTNHVVHISNLQSSSNYQYRVVSTASGYASCAKEGDGFKTQPSYTALVNGGFENGTANWTYWEVYPWGYSHDGTRVDWPGHIGYSINAGVHQPTPASKEGSCRITGECGWASGVGGYYQTAGVANGTYLVSGWIAADFDGGDEVIELVGMNGLYTSGIPTGTTIGRLTDTSNWIYVTNTVNVTTGKLTVALRVSQYSAVNVVTGHFDGITVKPAVRESINSIKNKAKGSFVVTKDALVVSSIIGTNTFYAQEPNRSSGIRVVTTNPHGLSVGQTVSVCGTLSVMNSEARIDSASISNVASGTAPKPVAMTNAALGGGASGVQPGIDQCKGINNIGLLVRTCGQFAKTSNTNFTVSDGSGVSVKCTIPAGVTLNSAWQYVTVSGISSCETDILGKLQRVIKVRDQNDIAVIK